MSGGEREHRYCPYCDQKRPIQTTVPWQDDLCRECGNSVPSEEERSEPESS